MSKIRTICIDTLTGIQTDEFMESEKKPGHNEWMDYGKDIWKLISYLNDNNFTTIMILGEPGTGKSTGMRSLPTKTNIWINADKKDPNWTGGKEEYGKKFAPKLPHHYIPNSYKDIYNHINELLKRDLLEEERFVILTGHIQDYKSGTDNKKRLKTLGKVATAMQLEGRLNNVYYSNVIRENGQNKYVLETQTDGYNTARSPMGLFEPVIENDYNFIIEKLMSY